MTIKFLKAGSGDSILITHNNRNIIIDGGTDGYYLYKEVEGIYKRNEKIDLLVITHHDDDHIRGIIELLKAIEEEKFGDKYKIVDRVIFNSPRLVLGKLLPPPEKRLLSYKQAHEVEELLTTLKVNWKVTTNESDPIEFDGLILKFLSPKMDDIQKYSENSGAYLSSDYKCDWDSAMHTLERYIDDKSQDESLFNQSSVVILAEVDDKKVLLTADVTPRRFEEIISKLVAENNGTAVEFDYLKLPHHGSYRNLNKKIIENILCKNFIITTDSTKYFLPNKRAVLKIAKYLTRGKSDTINFHFNYSEALTNINISEKELKEYNLKLIPNTHQYGTVI